MPHLKSIPNGIVASYKKVSENYLNNGDTFPIFKIWSSSLNIGGITQDEYGKKAIELKQRQYELNNQLIGITEADENYSMTLISLLNICSKAPELFNSSKVEQKRQLINFLLSNLRLRGKKLEYTLKKPFDVLVNLDYRSNWLPK